MTDVLIIGGGLAGLVVAVLQARAGRAVTLLTDGRTPGGHFAGMQVDGLDFDLGMVMFEQHQPATPCDDWRDFDPRARNDWTRFGHRVSAWLNAETPLRRVPTPQVVVDGRSWPDYLIANRLEALADAGARFEPPAALPPGSQLHASAKLRPGPYDQLSYAEAAQWHHGAALHAHYIDPFVRKLTGIGSDACLARLHRAAWAPLFYPETLRDAMAGRPVTLAEYPFWTTPQGCVSSWVRQLLAQAHALPTLTRIDSPLSALTRTPGGVEASTEDGQHHRAADSAQAVLALPPERARGLLGLPALAAQPAASVALLLASLAADALREPIGCTMLVDEDTPLYRLTSPEGLAGLAGTDHPRVRLVAEASPERLQSLRPDADPATVLRDELARQISVAPDALQVHRHLVARQALVLPTRAALESGNTHHHDIGQQLPGAHLTGALLGYGTSSLNDQLAQALQIHEALPSH